MRRKIAFIFGTRPEAIKLCPLVLAMRGHPQLEPSVCVTGQHRQMLDQVLEAFEVRPDIDLALMQPNQTLASISARVIVGVDQYIEGQKPDLVVVQGDTTTAMCAALAAFYRKVPVAHVEAGLRTGDKQAPFPEEINRILASRLADYHFAPTQWASENLLREGVSKERVWVTGNTVIDALQIAVAKVRDTRPAVPGVPRSAMESQQRMVLITGHRRENFGDGFESICRAIASLSERFQDVIFVYPVHLNPNVREPVFRLLKDRGNVLLIEPLTYLPFVALMERSAVILTDSGGVQEEAPSLGKPVLVMRDTTERPEAVAAGTVKLVGSDEARIVQGLSTLLTDAAAYGAMARATNPYGDGRACPRIVRVMEEQL